MIAGKVFGPLHFTRHDLAVLTIMRGRDHGVLDYNSARVAYGLPAVTDWADINPWLYDADPRVRSQIFTMAAASSGKCSVTVCRPSVCPSVGLSHRHSYRDSPGAACDACILAKN